MPIKTTNKLLGIQEREPYRIYPNSPYFFDDIELWAKGQVSEIIGRARAGDRKGAAMEIIKLALNIKRALWPAGGLHGKIR